MRPACQRSARRGSRDFKGLATGGLGGGGYNAHHLVTGVTTGNRVASRSQSRVSTKSSACSQVSPLLAQKPAKSSTPWLVPELNRTDSCV